MGLILAKDLIFIDPEDEVPMRNFYHLFSRPIQAAWPEDKLADVLQKFRNSHGHMAIVRDVEQGEGVDNRYKVVGIITLEDIFERILGNEIIDETDTVDEYNQVVKNRNRDFDLMRMSIINPSILGLDKRQQLSPDEVRVITAHLQANVPVVAQLVGSNQQAIEALVRSSTVVELKRARPADGSEDTIHAREQHPENVLYKRGKVANYCVLILSGKATVIVGKDDFRSEVGSWMTLGASALSPAEEEYVPDFSAFVESDELKYLRIAKPLNAGALLSTPQHSISSVNHPPAPIPISPIQSQSSLKKQAASLQQARHYSGPLAPLTSKFAAPTSRGQQQRLLKASRESTSAAEQESEPLVAPNVGMLSTQVSDDGRLGASHMEEKSDPSEANPNSSHTINIDPA